jgi:hypothetical protein
MANRTNQQLHDDDEAKERAHLHRQREWPPQPRHKRLVVCVV